LLTSEYDGSRVENSNCGDQKRLSLCMHRELRILRQYQISGCFAKVKEMPSIFDLDWNALCGKRNTRMWRKEVKC
jgi:hypothetical protein